MKQDFLAPNELIDALIEHFGVAGDADLGRFIGVDRQTIYQLRKSTKIDPKTKLLNLLLRELKAT